MWLGGSLLTLFEIFYDFHFYFATKINSNNKHHKESMPIFEQQILHPMDQILVNIYCLDMQSVNFYWPCNLILKMPDTIFFYICS